MFYFVFPLCPQLWERRSGKPAAEACGTEGVIFVIAFIWRVGQGLLVQ